MRRSQPSAQLKAKILADSIGPIRPRGKAGPLPSLIIDNISAFFRANLSKLTVVADT